MSTRKRNSFEHTDLAKELTLVLHNKASCYEFKVYLQTRHCEENIYFWLDVEAYQDPLVTPTKQLNEKAQQLYDKYFSDNSEYQLNLDSDLVFEVLNRIKTGQINRLTFNNAQKAIFKVMETDCIGKFCEQNRGMIT